MILPPAVTIYGLAHARAAVALGLPVLLLSAPGAAAYAGCGWWRAVMAQLDQPSVPDALDCSTQPGRALEALSTGCKLLILLPCPAWDDVADRAARCGATVLPTRPPSLDMGGRNAAWLLPGWLNHNQRNGDSGGQVG